jgi:hypothetical protein
MAWTGSLMPDINDPDVRVDRIEDAVLPIEEALKALKA